MNDRIRTARARALPSLVSALVLAACGGGGSGGGPAPLTAPTTPVAISEANAEALAALSADLAMGGFGMVTMYPVAVETDGDPAPVRRVVARIASDAVRRASQASHAPQTVTGAVQTTPCDESGSMTISQEPTSASITLNQCSDYPGEVTNGSVSVSNVVETGGPYSGSISADLSMDVTHTAGASSVRIVASVSFSRNWNGDVATSAIGGSYLGVSDGLHTVVLSNFSFSETLDDATGILTSSSNFTLASTEFGGAVTVATLEDFQWDYYFSAYPYDGTLAVTGAGGASVRLSVLGDERDPSWQLLLELDSNGDGIPDAELSRDWLPFAAQ